GDAADADLPLLPPRARARALRRARDLARAGDPGGQAAVVAVSLTAARAAAAQRDLLHGAATIPLHASPAVAEVPSMQAGLFTSQDVAALRARRALAAQRPLTPAEWAAAFAARGLLDEAPADRPQAA